MKTDRQTADIFRDFDWLGGLFFAAAIISGLTILTSVGRTLPLESPLTILAITSCVTSTITFAATENWIARNPLVPPRLIMTNGIGALCLIQILVLAARFGVSPRANAGPAARFLTWKDYGSNFTLLHPYTKS